MAARRSTPVMVGVGLVMLCSGLLGPGVAGAAEARPGPGVAWSESTIAVDGPASEPDIPAVGARRKPRGPTSSPPLSVEPQGAPPPPDMAPPPGPLVPPPAPPEPAPPASAPSPIPQDETAPEPTARPGPPPPARAPAGEPRAEPSRRLPTTGDRHGSGSAGVAGALLTFGGFLVAAGARRRHHITP